jgi:hypothetical protein
MNKILQLLRKLSVYIVLFIAVLVLSLVLNANITSLFFGYKLRSYYHEIDSLFNPNIIDQVFISKVLSSGKRGSIFYGNIGYLKLLIIESSNYNLRNFNEVQSLKTKQIDRNDFKTYLSITEPMYPDIDQMLNPPKSQYINLKILDSSSTYIEEKQIDYYYLKGNFQRIALTNSLNCSIITFLKKENNEILIIRKRDMLISIIRLDTLRKFSNIINPKYFKGPF